MSAPLRSGTDAAPLEHRGGPSAAAPPGAWHRHRHRWLLLVVAVGGMLGAAARYALELASPTPPGGFPWPTLVTNASGCLLIGVLMVHVVEVGRAHPLVRPFLGVGLLGGYTTFSTYAVQSQTLLTGQHPVKALLYLGGTLAAAMTAVVLGVFAARGLHAVRRRLIHRRGGM